MPSLSDIFNPSFFMCLGILVLLTALIVVYFESKMREQNHKIASMLSLVSSLAEEQNNLRMEVFRMVTTGQNNFPVNNSQLNNLPGNNFPFNSKNENSELINVSDDDADSEDDNDSDNDSDNEDDNDSEDDSDNDSDSDLEENEVIEIGDNDVKVLKININNKESNEDDFNIEQIDNLEELGENTDDDDDLSLNEIDEESSSDDDDDDLKEETIHSVNLEETEAPKLDLNAIDFKQISISGLEKDANDTETMDYKKLSLNKLKSLVVEKGLTKDSSKLKKNELLNLLGVK